MLVIAQSTTQGFSLNQILHNLSINDNTKNAHFTNVKHIHIIPKLVPSVLLSQNMANKVWRYWHR